MGLDCFDGYIVTVLLIQKFLTETGRKKGRNHLSLLFSALSAVEVIFKLHAKS